MGLPTAHEFNHSKKVSALIVVSWRKSTPLDHRVPAVGESQVDSICDICYIQRSLRANLTVTRRVSVEVRDRMDDQNEEERRELC